MIDQSTRDTIQDWAYSGGSAGKMAAVSAQPTLASTPATGMLAAATPQPTGYAPPPAQWIPGGSTSKPTASGSAAPTSTWANMATATIAPTDLTQRTVDPKTQTVNGQMQTLMSENSPLLQQAKADAMRTANERGMLNSTMAASGGTDAMLRSALSIATPDAAQYAHAADYNAAAENQAVMYNADQKNATEKVKAQLSADEATRAQQKYLAEMQDQTSRYNTDIGYRQQVDANKKSLVNNILQNMEFSPDRKSSMLAALGEGTTPTVNPDGTYAPGTGLAGAVWVIDSVSADLQPNGGTSAPTNYRGGAGGMIDGAYNNAAEQVYP